MSKELKEYMYGLHPEISEIENSSDNILMALDKLMLKMENRRNDAIRDRSNNTPNALKDEDFLMILYLYMDVKEMRDRYKSFYESLEGFYGHTGQIWSSK